MPNESPSQSSSPRLRLDGEVRQPTEFSFQDLSAMTDGQIIDVSRLAGQRVGDAVALSALLQRVQPTERADYLGLHSTHDDFHASIPLSAVRDRAFVIYRVAGEPLGTASGGPFRFFIPDHAACHATEVDECANVKYVDHMELTHGKGYDNRPENDADHAALHESSPE